MAFWRADDSLCRVLALASVLIYGSYLFYTTSYATVPRRGIEPRTSRLSDGIHRPGVLRGIMMSFTPGSSRSTPASFLAGVSLQRGILFDLTPRVRSATRSPDVRLRLACAHHAPVSRKTEVPTPQVLPCLGVQNRVPRRWHVFQLLTRYAGDPSRRGTSVTCEGAYCAVAPSAPRAAQLSAACVSLHP